MRGGVSQDFIIVSFIFDKVRVQIRRTDVFVLRRFDTTVDANEHRFTWS